MSERMESDLKLFCVTVAVTHKFTEDVLIAAEDGESALDYMNRNPEWRQDGIFEFLVRSAASMEPVAAKRLNSLAGIPSGADKETIVWWDGCSDEFAPQYTVEDILTGGAR